MSAAEGGPPLHERLERAAFHLVLLTFAASILFASAPLPLGGPNVVLASAAIAVFALRTLAKRSIELHRSFALFLLCGLLTAAWAGWVHASTGTLGYTRLGQIGIGLGISAATYAAVTAGNVQLILYAITLSVLASAAFGLAVLHGPDAFGAIWRAVATVDESQLGPVLEEGWLAGIANSIDTFSSHVAVAVPIAVGMWLHHAGRGAMPRGRLIALNLLLLSLAAAALMTGSRSLVAAVVLGGAAVAAVMTFRRPCGPRRKTPHFASRIVLTVSCLYVAGVLLIHRGELAGGHPGAVPILRVSPEAAGPLPAPDRAAPAGGACTESLGAVFPPVSVSGRWREDCVAAHGTAPARGEYARYYSFSIKNGAFLALRAVTKADCCRLALLPGNASASNAGARPLKERRIGSDDGPILARLRRGEYTLAVITDERGLSQDFRLRIAFDLANSWFPSFDLERFFSIGTLSSRHRYRMFEVAYRYALDYPMGFGGFFPAGRHLALDMSPELRRNFLEKELHNHLLVVLTHYGLPGLALALLFFGFLFWSAGRSVILAGRSRNAYGLYLSGIAAGMLTACFVFMLFFSVGPFFHGWHYFLVFGLVFAVQRMLTADGRAAEAGAAGAGAGGMG